MEAHPILLQKKYARVICGYANELHIAPQEALACFYRSRLYVEMSQGISDMHCRSDAYLIEELRLECCSKK